jgi:phosphoribosylglycinamide formyltransferase 1
MSEKKKLAVLISGGGTTFQYIQDRIEDGTLNARTVVVVSSRDDAFGLTRAANHGIPSQVVRRKDFGPAEIPDFNRKLAEAVLPYNPDLVVLAGFMSLLTPDFISHFPGRIMNTHPALIPTYCGEGFYGDHVHKAVVDRGLKTSGVTIHFVDELYDHGPIIIQKTVGVEFEDTYKDVAAKVQAVEKPAYAEAIRLFIEDRLEVVGGRVRVLPERVE